MDFIKRQVVSKLREADANVCHAFGVCNCLHLSDYKTPLPSTQSLSPPPARYAAGRGVEELYRGCKAAPPQLCYLSIKSAESLHPAQKMWRILLLGSIHLPKGNRYE